MLVESFDPCTLAGIDAEKLIGPFLTAANPSALIVQRQALEWLEHMNVQVTETTRRCSSRLGMWDSVRARAGWRRSPMRSPDGSIPTSGSKATERPGGCLR